MITDKIRNNEYESKFNYRIWSEPVDYFCPVDLQQINPVEVTPEQSICEAATSSLRIRMRIIKTRRTTILRATNSPGSKALAAKSINSYKTQIMTLSRKGFFSGLIAIASAIIAKAQTGSGQAATTITPCPNPECGYRAPTLPNKILTWEEAIEHNKYGELYWHEAYLRPFKRLNRCPNCNTAFWQDPEPPAKEG